MACNQGHDRKVKADIRVDDSNGNVLNTLLSAQNGKDNNVFDNKGMFSTQQIDSLAHAHNDKGESGNYREDTLNKHRNGHCDEWNGRNSKKSGVNDGVDTLKGKERRDRGDTLNSDREDREARNEKGTLKDEVGIDSLAHAHNDKGENSKAKANTSNPFFMTKVSHFMTKVSHFMTPSILYNTNNTNISLIKNQRVYIPFSSEKGEKGKRGSLAFSLKSFLQSSFCNIESFFLKESKELQAILGDEIGVAAAIKPMQALQNRLSQVESTKLKYFAANMAKTGIFSIKEVKLALQQRIAYLLDNKQLDKALNYSIYNNSLWLYLDENDAKSDDLGLHRFKQFWHYTLEKIEFLAQAKAESMLEKYEGQISHFIAYRHAKHRYFNEASLMALCRTLSEFKDNNIDVTLAIRQSIERDYNWVFPPTHRKRRFGRKKKVKAARA